ncbi:MAG: hypothetical protein WCO02_00020 [Bacteroidota bacterium]
MKATVCIAIFALILTTNILYASNDNTTITNKEVNTSMIISLVPTTPKEATFEDATTINLTDLSPVNPVEADFSDVDYEMTPAFSTLAPITPSEADFNDSEIQNTDFKALAPVTPTVADIADLN